MPFGVPPPTLLTPANGGTVPAASSNVFTWHFNSLYGETQASADLRWKVSGGGSWTTITGASSTSTASYTFAGATFTVGTSYEWQVRTTSSTPNTSAWSGSFIFTAVGAVPAAPTITVPTTGATIYTSPLSVTWTNAGGVSQTAYEIRRTDSTAGTQVYYDSGPVTSTAHTAVPVPLDTAPGRTDHIQVRVQSGGQWSAYGEITIVNGASGPATPLVWATPDPSTATVTVRIVNPAGSAPTATTDLYRADSTGLRVRIAAALPLNALFIDRYPGAGIVSYQAIASSPSGTTSPQVLSDIGAAGGSLNAVFSQYATLADV